MGSASAAEATLAGEIGRGKARAGWGEARAGWGVRKQEAGV
jgi:hypothetical protein